MISKYFICLYYYFLWHVTYSKHFTGIAPSNLHSNHLRVDHQPHFSKMKTQKPSNMIDDIIRIQTKAVVILHDSTILPL